METLKLARAAIGKDDFAAAKEYYGTILDENPKDLEAAWFYLFSVLVKDPVGKDTPKNYKMISNLFYPTLEYIATFEESEEKHNLVFVMVKGFPQLKGAVKESMLNLLVKDSSAIPTEEYGEFTITPEVDKGQLADRVLEIFGEDGPYCLLVVDIWKEQIAKRYRWSEYRNFQDKGKELWFDELAKKIKKYDPSYEMPQFKQAGCVSSGDAGKVKPGE